MSISTFQAAVLLADEPEIPFDNDLSADKFSAVSGEGALSRAFCAKENAFYLAVMPNG